MSDSKIEYLDKAFLGTMDSQGFKNAKLAIKYVLFDDENSIDKKLRNGDKWRFISSNYNGRELAKKLHQMDLMHILVEFCYEYFGLLNREFKMNKERYLEIKESMFPTMALTSDELVEFIVYAALISVEEVYVLLSTHKDIVMSLVDLLIKERYLDNKREELDNFKGIEEPVMAQDEYDYFMGRYSSLDIEFSLMKRKNPDYN